MGRGCPRLEAVNEPEAATDQQAEIELLQRIGQGDRKSFEQFYDRFSRILFTVAYRLLGNKEAAEDVLQEVFVKIWEKAPGYDPARGKPLTWAVTLTRYRAIDLLRSLRRRGQLNEEVKHEAQADEQFDDRSSFLTVVAGEQHAFVRDAIKKLSDEQREAIELAFFNSLTQVEIAERLNQPLGTVKARIRRGLIKLRALIGTPP